MIKNIKGKRMVSEELIKKLEDLQPGGGGDVSVDDFVAGEGIVIAEDEGKVGISVDDETLVFKSDLAEVATSGDYDDLINKPEIPEAPLVLTAMTGTLTDEQYASLDEKSVIEYKESSGITRVYYFYNDSSTQLEYRTNPIFNNSTTGNVYRFVVTKADKTYGLNYSLGNNLLPSMPGNGSFKLTASRSGSTVTPPAWKIDYPDPDTTTAGSYNLEATVDSQGGITYDWAAGGSGSSYTFTGGLTENAGTVTWDLNNQINLNAAGTGTLSANNSGIYYTPRKNILIDSNGGSINQGSVITNYSTNNLLVGQNNQIRNNNSSNNILIGNNNKTNASGSNANMVFGLSNSTGSYARKECLILGCSLEAQKDGQIVLGRYNVADTSNLFVLGGGTDVNNKANVMTVGWDGTIVSKNLPAVDTTTDGTYVLKATVVNGAVTYAWVLEA